MGWNSATPYFDQTLHAALAAIAECIQEELVDWDLTIEVGSVRYPVEVIDRGRPVAKVLADLLAEGDWDVQDESEFFLVYGEELLPDGRFEEYIAEQNED
jgi:hypothetical protein